MKLNLQFTAPLSRQFINDLSVRRTDQQADWDCRPWSPPLPLLKPELHKSDLINDSHWCSHKKKEKTPHKHPLISVPWVPLLNCRIWTKRNHKTVSFRLNLTVHLSKSVCRDPVNSLEGICWSLAPFCHSTNTKDLPEDKDLKQYCSSIFPSVTVVFLLKTCT